MQTTRSNSKKSMNSAATPLGVDTNKLPQSSAQPMFVSQSESLQVPSTVPSPQTLEAKLAALKASNKPATPDTAGVSSPLSGNLNSQLGSATSFDSFPFNFDSFDEGVFDSELPVTDFTSSQQPEFPAVEVPQQSHESSNGLSSVDQASFKDKTEQLAQTPTHNTTSTPNSVSSPQGNFNTPVTPKPQPLHTQEFTGVTQTAQFKPAAEAITAQQEVQKPVVKPKAEKLKNSELSKPVSNTNESNTVPEVHTKPAPQNKVLSFSNFSRILSGGKNGVVANAGKLQDKLNKELSTHEIHQG